MRVQLENRKDIKDVKIEKARIAIGETCVVLDEGKYYEGIMRKRGTVEYFAPCGTLTHRQINEVTLYDFKR